MTPVAENVFINLITAVIQILIILATIFKAIYFIYMTHGRRTPNTKPYSLYNGDYIRSCTEATLYDGRQLSN